MGAGVESRIGEGVRMDIDIHDAARVSYLADLADRAAYKVDEEKERGTHARRGASATARVRNDPESKSLAMHGRHQCAALRGGGRSPRVQGERPLLHSAAAVAAVANRTKRLQQLKETAGALEARARCHGGAQMAPLFAGLRLLLSQVPCLEYQNQDRQS